MVVILIGADCSGKSSTFEQLRKKLPFCNYIKESYVPSVEEKKKRIVKLKQLSQDSQITIYDRATAIDDFIYSQIIDKEDSCLKDDVDTIVDILQKCLVVRLYCDTEILQKRLQERKDEYIDEQSVVKIDEKYLSFFEYTGIKPLSINTNHNKPEEVAQMIINEINKKKPRIAEIVPVSCLKYTAENQYFMCLANLVAKSEEYTNFYKKKSAEGRFVLMDNGAAEEEQLNNDQLIECYQKVNPTEIVLPDTLCDGEVSYIKTMDAMEYFESKRLPYRYMAVPQGKTLEEWCECAEKLLQHTRINAIGVSKFLEMITKDKDVRVKAVEWLDKKATEMDRRDIEVHLLGCSEGPAPVKKAFENSHLVRGCDSAIGYLYSQAGIANVEPTSTRPAGEIDFLNGEENLFVNSALQTFEKSCGIDNNGVDDSWKTKEDKHNEENR